MSPKEMPLPIGLRRSRGRGRVRGRLRKWWMGMMKRKKSVRRSWILHLRMSRDQYKPKYHNPYYQTSTSPIHNPLPSTPTSRLPLATRMRPNPNTHTSNYQTNSNVPSVK